MMLTKLFKHVLNGLWLIGGISAAAELSLEDFGPGAWEPCPREAEYPFCSTLEAPTCQAPCSISSPTPPYRCS